MNILKALGDLIPSIGRSIEKIIPDKDLARKLTHEIEVLVLGIQSGLIQAKSSIIIAEAQGASWIQRSWRPITMLTFVLIIANNYIIVPYAVSFGLEVPMLDIPPGMWGLLTVGIGGYIGGRSYEKGVKIKADAAKATV
jgi:hypothetical protein